MSSAELAKSIGRELPFLRRYARALTGSQSAGDNYAAATLEAILSDRNLMDGLDQAALRRFDLKVKFDFLRANQAWELLSRHCKGLGLPQPKPDEQARISRLASLTPGDFAAVVRQHRFRPIASATAFVSALEAECARLVPLGAVRVRLLPADDINESCIVMQDVEGNEFCLD